MAKNKKKKDETVSRIMSASERQMAALIKEAGGALKSVKLKKKTNHK